MPAAIVVANLLVTGYLTGLIWFVQMVHYPLFAQVERTGFGRYHLLHSRRTTAVVAAPMVAELVLSLQLLLSRPAAFPVRIAWSCGALTLVVWAATFLVSVPIHTRLGQDGFSSSLVADLVRTNWIRTSAWSLRLGLLACGLLAMLQ